MKNPVIGLLFLTQFIFVHETVAFDRFVPKIEGCRIRSSAFDLLLMPDFVPGGKRVKGTLKSRSDDALAASEKIEENVGGDTGYVFFCRCRTKSSSPVTLLAAIEFKLENGKYKPDFAYIRFRGVADLSRTESTTLLTSKNLAAQNSESALSAKEIVGATRASVSGQFAGRHTIRNENPQITDRNSVSNLSQQFGYLSWSNEGQKPVKELTIMPLGPTCEEF